MAVESERLSEMADIVLPTGRMCKSNDVRFVNLRLPVPW